MPYQVLKAMVYAGKQYEPGDILDVKKPKRSMLSTRKIRWVDTVLDEHGKELLVPGSAPPRKVGDPSVDHSDPATPRREGQTAIPAHPPAPPEAEVETPATVDEIIQKGFSRDSAEDIVLLVLDGMSIEDAEAKLLQKQQGDHEKKRVQPGGLFATGPKPDKQESTKQDVEINEAPEMPEVEDIPSIDPPKKTRTWGRTKKTRSKK